MQEAVTELPIGMASLSHVLSMLISTAVFEAARVVDICTPKILSNSLPITCFRPSFKIGT